MDQKEYLEQFKTRAYGRNLLKKEGESAMDQMEEECGVLGVYSPENIDTFSMAQFGLFALQHRGQEACGISVLKDGKIINRKEPGLVLDVFKRIENPDDYIGNAVIGHTRYTTAQDRKSYHLQPFFAKNEYDQMVLSVAYNGNLTNTKELRKEMEEAGVAFRATSDAEMILRQIQRNMDLGIIESVKMAMSKMKGAYSVVGITRNKFFAFRDRNGIRPLVLGAINEKTYVAASETCALDAIGAQYIRDILPGEIVYCSEEEGMQSFMTVEKPVNRLCSFEYVYFARPDSTLDGRNVYKVREQCGEKLWEQAPVDADVVIGVPDSGIPGAIGLSKASGIPFRPFLIKNRYMARSFIVPTQEMRERVVNLKLNPIVDEIRGKRTVIVDDSIVRGTTAKRLVKILKDAGAKEIHFRSFSPPVIAPCYLGIDTPEKKDLIAANMSKDELRDYLGVDSLEFLSIENLIEILGDDRLCFGCMTGKYPVRNYDGENDFVDE